MINRDYVATKIREYEAFFRGAQVSNCVLGHCHRDAVISAGLYDKGGRGHLAQDIMRERVIDRVDHTSLNEDVDFLRGVIPTAENLARCFWQQLAPAIENGELYEVVLEETERNSVRYRGEDE